MQFFFFNFLGLRKFYPNIYQLNDFVQAKVSKTNTNESNVTNTAESSTILFNLGDSSDSYLFDDASGLQNSLDSMPDTPHSNNIAFGSCSVFEFDQNSTPSLADSNKAEPKQIPKIINGTRWMRMLCSR